MRWRRRRAMQPAAGAALTPRTERALVALVVHAQQLDDRIGRLERRIDDDADAAVTLPTHDDLLEVRLHSARVAAELSRVVVELRAEIDRASAGPVLTPHQRRVNTVAETIVD